MPGPFHTRPLTLGELFGTHRRLCVPDYQRAYSWSTGQAGQLLDDVLLAMDDAGEDLRDSDGDYFFGAIVLMANESGEAGSGEMPVESYEIVDGVQRLATLTIVLAVLRDLLADVGSPKAVEAAHCIEPQPTYAPVDMPGPRLKLSHGLKDFFRDFVQAPGASAAMPDDRPLVDAEERLLAVREHLMAALIEAGLQRQERLVEFLLQHCHCAAITTTTLDRAHRIFSVLNDRGSPLTRSEILKAQLLGAMSAERRAQLSETWIGLERRLGGTMEELFSHVRTIEGRSRTRIIEDIRALVRLSGGADAFVEGMLLPYARIFEIILAHPDAPPAPSQQIAQTLCYLRWLGNQDWLPPLLLFWREVNGEPAALEHFVARLDRLAYAMRILGVGGDKRVTRFRAVIAAIRSGTLDGPDSPLELTRDEARLLAYNLRSLYVRSQLACKLVLMRLNDVLAGSPQNLDPNSLTVEHVLPQKPARKSQWREWFPAHEERERCTQSLGNLILVSRERNEKARNLDLAHKLDAYFSGSAVPPLITRDIDGITEWRTDDVQRREQRLLGVLGSLWELSLAARQPHPARSAANA